MPLPSRVPLGAIFATGSSRLALSLVLAMVILALGADYIAPYDPLSAIFPPFLPPCREHPFGTDDLGRDVFSRTIHGTRVSLLVGFTSAVMAIAIGLLVGLLSGYFGGPIDGILMRITDTFQVIPRLVLATVMVAFFGASIWNVIFVLGILSWPRTARTVRSLVLTIKEQAFVEAARAIGLRDFDIIFRHVVPNVASTVAVLVGYEMASAILIEAGLSFLGLGDPNLVSWGKIIHEGQKYFRLGWWMPLFPGLFLSMLVVSVNAVADSLSFYLNPKLRPR
ncbi:MAG: ABC transporter permease [Fervidicoccaceae archaeon]